MEKRYYWLRLKDDFFNSKRIKKLRRLAGGDTYTIIYLKMQLLSLKHEGVIEYTGLESSFAEELALDLDEAVENVQVTLQYLKNCGLIETSDNISFILPYAVENTGSEGSSAKRMRELRARNDKALPVSEDPEPVTLCDQSVTMCAQRYGEKEIEKEIESEKEIERKERDREKRKKNSCAEPQPAEASAPPVITIPLNDGTEYPVTEEQVAEWMNLYPAVDIMQQLRNMRGWAINNPKKRKTKNGVKRFINSWLAKEQDKYHPTPPAQNQQRGGATFMDMWRDEYGGGQ